MHELKFCLERVAEYESRIGQPGYSQHTLSSMKNGCAHRRELQRSDLNDERRHILLQLIGNEPAELWAKS